jgi:hypothetical protein
MPVLAKVCTPDIQAGPDRNYGVKYLIPPSEPIKNLAERHFFLNTPFCIARVLPYITIKDNLSITE